MKQRHSRPRQQAENAFRKLQAPVIVSDLVELDQLADARHEKTARLRAARLAKELADRTSAAAALIARRSVRTSTNRSTD